MFWLEKKTCYTNILLKKIFSNKRGCVKCLHQEIKWKKNNNLYNFVLDSNITDRERKIGLIAKKDFEKGKYSLSVINKTSSSLQQEALKNGLSDEVSAAYKTLIPIITKLSPIGLNRGNMMLNQNYLNN